MAIGVSMMGDGVGPIRRFAAVGLSVAAFGAVVATAGTAVAGPATPNPTTTTTIIGGTTSTTTPASPDAGRAGPSPSPNTTDPTTVPPSTATTTASGSAARSPTTPRATSGTPVVTVTPDAGLLHGQMVTVAGTGFTPGAPIGMAECQVGATDQGGCDLSTARTTTADSTGTWAVAFTVRRELQIGSGTMNCVPEGCTIGAANLNNTTGEKAGMPLHFADVPPPPPPMLTVSPSTGLLHRQSVNVAGSGWAPNQPVLLSQCLQSTNQCNINSGFALTSDTGGFATTFTVQREVGIPGGTLTDCLSTPCVLRARAQNDLLAQNEVKLSFANVPLPPKPVLTVTPSTGLGARQVITVTGHGYAANEPLNLDECTRTSTFANYSCYFFQGGAVTDATGSFATTVTARRFIPGNPPQQIDCAPSACLIAVYSFEDVLASTGADLAFDPNAPKPPPPTVRVSPSTGLVDGQAVTVSGSGFSPKVSVGMSECRAGATSPSDCANDSNVAQTDANGSFSIQFTVHTPLRITSYTPGSPIGSGPVPPTPTTTTVDCTHAPGACIIGAANLADFTEGAQAPLSFAANPNVNESPPAVAATPVVATPTFTG